MIKTIEWTDRGVVMIDQRKLPTEEVYNTYESHQEIAEAIKSMVIRGAPAIGVAAAMGIALGVKNSRAENSQALEEEFNEICRVIGATRPTAVNLFWAIERMKSVFQHYKTESISALKRRLEQEALTIYAEDIAANQCMGKHGQSLIGDGARILTHCNAGALATAGFGTALGVIRAAVNAGKKVSVYADETRPFLQGARLTAWELMRDNIPVTLITDNMAGHFMKKGAIDCVIVGADRIAANGDVANKIGTYSVAVLAKENGIPFYVAAPRSTIDLSIPSGDRIPIEERHVSEVTELLGQRIAPDEVKAANPAFDVTPNKYISAIITEAGVARPPYEVSLRQLT
jgi:methylthioribose-1-phosphate isomerase